MKAELILHIENTKLGEGPVWDHRIQQLWWVDILNGLLHCFDPKNGYNQSYSLGQYIGAAVPCEEEGLIVALQEGFAFFNPKQEVLKMIHDPESDKPLNRFNDGKCDPAGRFWAGTMEIVEKKPTGGLYSVENNLCVSKKLEKIFISNGLAWTKDAKTMYYIDTMTSKVQSFSYDQNSGEIEKEKDVLIFDKSMGYPDGMCIDENDHLWIAFYEGGKVCCYDPLSGEQLEQIDVPARKTTSCAFGGENLDQLFITTAAKKGDDHGGALFVAQPGVKGRRANFFKQIAKHETH